MENFEFYRADSVADAVQRIRAGGDAKFLAGGQSLIPVMKLDLAMPEALVSLANIDELRGIDTDGHGVVIGAMVTHAEVADSRVVKEAIPALAEMAGQIGDAQVRNRGTLGGSVAHGDPAADYPAALIGLGATVITDRREIGADDFFTGFFETALEEGELIRAVRFPVPSKAAYAKFPNPASKYAIVGVFVADGPQGLRVAVTGASSCAHRFTAMEQALTASFDPAAVEGVTVPVDEMSSDPDASAEYRAHLVTVMAKRAVEACG
jgi:carbon-monoxide dehydrogenase medium subunit